MNAEREQAGRKGIKYRNIIKVKQLIYEEKKRYALEATAKAPNVAQFSMLPHATPQAPNYCQPADEWTNGRTTDWLVGCLVSWLGG